MAWADPPPSGHAVDVGATPADHFASPYFGRRVVTLIHPRGFAPPRATMCLTCGCKMPNDRHKPGDIIWADIEKAGENWELTPSEALHNLEECAKLVKK